MTTAQPALDALHLAAQSAEVIRRGFDAYEGSFQTITRRAPTRFAARDWAGMQTDASERLDVYSTKLGEVDNELRALLGQEVTDKRIWSAMRREYASGIAGYAAGELAETFFNSATRRVFSTAGVDAEIEFIDYAFARVAPFLGRVTYHTYVRGDSTRDAIEALLDDRAFAVPYVDVAADADAVATRIEQAWDDGKAPMPFEDVEVLEPVFYRRKGAYLVGRVRGGNRVMPVVLALRNEKGGVTVDAVLLSERDVSIVFSFTRSYFHADVPRPYEIIEFLRSLMPCKPIAELYSALGYNRHGKTELYRDLQQHLSRTSDRFVVAPGTRGMVMVVFTLPSYDVVFKVIRDQFAPPKQTTQARVRDRYRLVFRHDRAGRLVDAQEFEHMSFDRTRFSDELLEELSTYAGKSVTINNDKVVIHHLYTERRVRPLDLYLKEMGSEACMRAALDYGQAIRDLAATNVFPGDLLLKNFGVTRNGRVVFYDYDELCLLDDCVFRDVPEPRYPEDELSAEPWYHVGRHDVFPEEFERFLQLSGTTRAVFLERHGTLFTRRGWADLQERLRHGEVLDLYPYSSEVRLVRG
ncbi:MAG: bifunctional isocitrate dehydrogenase kinase/phosphatase [Gemmatimonadales bacterium]